MAYDNWPELVSSHAVGGRSCILVALLLVHTGAAIVLDADGVVAMGPAVVAHVASVLELTWFASAAAADTAAAVVLLVRDGLREQCDGVSEELDLRGDDVDLCVPRLRRIRDVRCELCCSFLVGNCGASDFLDVLPYGFRLPPSLFCVYVLKSLTRVLEYSFALA